MLYLVFDSVMFLNNLEDARHWAEVWHCHRSWDISEFVRYGEASLKPGLFRLDCPSLGKSVAIFAYMYRWLCYWMITLCFHNKFYTKWLEYKWVHMRYVSSLFWNRRLVSIQKSHAYIWKTSSMFSFRVTTHLGSWIIKYFKTSVFIGYIQGILEKLCFSPFTATPPSPKSL